MRLVVAGGGYVGVATAVGFAAHGHQVCLIETDPARAADLADGQLPFHEPSLAEPLRAASGAQLQVHHGYPPDLGPTDFAFVAVPTPTAPDGALETQYLESCVDSLVASGGPRLRLVIRSTVNPGTARALAQRLRASGFQGHVLSNPEFLREGSALTDFEAPQRRVIGGDDPDAVAALASLYDFSDAPILRTDATTAELIKVAVNSALALRVSMANEIARVALSSGADVETVLRGVGSDPRIGADFLTPGIGFGGSCLPKDLLALRAAGAAAGVDTPAFDGASATNAAMIEALLERIASLRDERGGQRLGVFGLGFKPGTDSIRDSRSIALVEAALARGWHVTVCAPLAQANAAGRLGERVAFAPDLRALVEASDIVVAVHPLDHDALEAEPGACIVDALGRPLPLRGHASVPSLFARI